MSIFKRKAAAATEAKPRYVECRSWHGISFHIRDTEDPSGQALCGYDPLDDASPVTPEEAVERSAHQHEGWRYCSSCLSTFTGGLA